VDVQAGRYVLSVARDQGYCPVGCPVDVVLHFGCFLGLGYIEMDSNVQSSEGEARLGIVASSLEE